MQQTVTASAASSTLITAATPSDIGGLSARRIVSVYNTDANDLYIKIGGAASTSDFTVVIPLNSYWESPTPIEGPVYGIWASDGSGSAFVTEYN